MASPRRPGRRPGGEARRAGRGGRRAASGDRAGRARIDRGRSPPGWGPVSSRLRWNPRGEPAWAAPVGAGRCGHSTRLASHRVRAGIKHP